MKKPSQIEKIKAILELIHELPVDEEAEKRVSEFLKPRGAEFDNIDRKECTNCDKLSAAWNTKKKAWVCRECAWVQYPSNAQGYCTEQVIESCDSPEEDKAWEYIEHVYNRKQATCLAMQFTGENLEEILAFMTEHTDGDWNVQSPDGEQEAFTIVENPLWARSKILFNSCWVVIFSSSKMKIMREEIFKREWE